jgi:tetratricopeptide (TPR) repeat protein
MANYDESLKLLEEALHKCRHVYQSSDRMEFGNIFVLFGNIYTKKRNFEKAIKSYYDSLRIRKYLGDKAGAANVKNQVGELLSSIDMTEMERARNFYSEALRIKTAIGGCDNLTITTPLVNIARLLVECDSNEIVLAEKFLNEGEIFSGSVFMFAITNCSLLIIVFSSILYLF